MTLGGDSMTISRNPNRERGGISAGTIVLLILGIGIGVGGAVRHGSILARLGAAVRSREGP